MKNQIYCEHLCNMAGFFISHEHILKGKDGVLYNKNITNSLNLKEVNQKFNKIYKTYWHLQFLNNIIVVN